MRNSQGGPCSLVPIKNYPVFPCSHHVSSLVPYLTNLIDSILSLEYTRSIGFSFPVAVALFQFPRLTVQLHRNQLADWLIAQAEYLGCLLYSRFLLFSVKHFDRALFASLSFAAPQTWVRCTDEGGNIFGRSEYFRTDCTLG